MQHVVLQYKWKVQYYNLLIILQRQLILKLLKVMRTLEHNQQKRYPTAVGYRFFLFSGVIQLRGTAE